MSKQTFINLLILASATPALAADPLSYWANGQYTYQCTRSQSQPFCMDAGCGGNRVNAFTAATRNEVTPQKGDSPQVAGVKDIFVNFNLVFEMDRLSLHHLKNQSEDFSAYGLIPVKTDSGSALRYDMDYSQNWILPADWNDKMSQAPPTITQILLDAAARPGMKNLKIKVNWEEPQNDDDYILMNYDCVQKSFTPVTGEVPPADASLLTLRKLSANVPDGKYQGVTHARNPFGVSRDADGTCQVEVKSGADSFQVVLDLHENGKAPLHQEVTFSRGNSVTSLETKASKDGSRSLAISFNQGATPVALTVTSNVSGLSKVSGIINSVIASCDQLKKSP